jgi:hypothetical protein
MIGQTEVGEIRFAFCVEQNISRFDVPMQNAMFAGIMNRARKLRD